MMMEERGGESRGGAGVHGRKQRKIEFAAVFRRKHVRKRQRTIHCHTHPSVCFCLLFCCCSLFLVGAALASERADKSAATKSNLAAQAGERGERERRRERRREEQQRRSEQSEQREAAKARAGRRLTSVDAEDPSRHDNTERELRPEPTRAHSTPHPPSLRLRSALLSLRLVPP